MYDSAGSHAEHAGMAVHTAHGDRGRLDTRMGTMYLMVPKVRQGGYIPFFVTERKRSEAALIQVVQESFLRTSLDAVNLTAAKIVHSPFYDSNGSKKPVPI